MPAWAQLTLHVPEDSADKHSELTVPARGVCQKAPVPPRSNEAPVAAAAIGSMTNGSMMAAVKKLQRLRGRLLPTMLKAAATSIEATLMP